MADSAKFGDRIYPAHAGINHRQGYLGGLKTNLPRTRGDKPNTQQVEDEDRKSTPHTRG